MLLFALFVSNCVVLCCWTNIEVARLVLVGGSFGLDRRIAHVSGDMFNKIWILFSQDWNLEFFFRSFSRQILSEYNHHNGIEGACDFNPIEVEVNLPRNPPLDQRSVTVQLNLFQMP